MGWDGLLLACCIAVDFGIISECFLWDDVGLVWYGFVNKGFGMTLGIVPNPG